MPRGVFSIKPRQTFIFYSGSVIFIRATEFNAGSVVLNDPGFQVGASSVIERAVSARILTCIREFYPSE